MLPATTGRDQLHNTNMHTACDAPNPYTATADFEAWQGNILAGALQSCVERSQSNRNRLAF
jgi:hypothetical protein